MQIPRGAGGKYNVKHNDRKPMPGWLPFVAGFVLVVQFAALGGWQISRGLEKRAAQQLYANAADFTAWSAGMAVRPYQRLQVQGRFDAGHQFLLDNIILNSRYGYYVLTPLVLDDHNALLLVNRGWIEKTTQGAAPDLPALDDASITVRGRAGSLPRAGYKMGAAISADPGWPRQAVYPTLADIAAELGRDVQPFVLLLEPDDEHGFVRYWIPEEMGPGRHFAYALQWFAMGGVLAALLAWHFRRRRAGRVSDD
jgi:cytochrome oxidase assembly protein ShyY1